MERNGLVELPVKSLDAYAPIVGAEEIRDIRALAGFVRSATVQNINSTAVGGGVAEILACLIPLMRDVGLDASWQVLDGSPEFFTVTKAIHNALHGDNVEVTPQMQQVFQKTAERNRGMVHHSRDFVIVHDPQPLGLVEARAGQARWLWRCHIDLSDADRRVWGYLRPLVERFDAAVFHLPDYAKELSIPQITQAPSIDPLTEKNMELAPGEVDSVLEGLQIDPRRPIVLQVSRFDRLKDPVGVIRAWELASVSHPCQLVLAGGTADDDPEGGRVLAEVREAAGKNPDIHVLPLPPNAHRQINALQRAATVVVQKSLREGFGLVVTEAMWKAKPVVGSAVGGIRRQIIHGTTGFQVHTIEGTAFRIRQLLGNPQLAKHLGENAKRYVTENFLPPANLKRWILALLSAKKPANPMIILG
jgi:trehalose synthase